jgi:mono/diheme cytochrome c family protein
MIFRNESQNKKLRQIRHWGGLKQKSDAEMLQIIADGKGKMPAYAKTLSPEEQQQVLTYMKTLGRP